MKKSSIGFTRKDWGNAHKVAARQTSVFQVYRKVMRRASLPMSKQYWTLAGYHSNDNCELPHAIKSGILPSPKQFHGVDREKDVILHNRKVHPEANWHHDDFTHALEVAIPFNPGLINFDMVCMVDHACHHVAQALYVLVKRDVRGVLLCVNFLLNNPREHSDACHSITDFWEWFYHSSFHGKVMRKALRAGWKVYPEIYLYDGADEKSNSYMETVYLYRR